jgi:hypothetical protein
MVAKKREPALTLSYPPASQPVMASLSSWWYPQETVRERISTAASFSSVSNDGELFPRIPPWLSAVPAENSICARASPFPYRHAYFVVCCLAT